jgi:hypothetical protein
MPPTLASPTRLSDANLDISFAAEERHRPDLALHAPQLRRRDAGGPQRLSYQTLNSCTRQSEKV